jgi:hypothetical protein
LRLRYHGVITVVGDKDERKKSLRAKMNPFEIYMKYGRLVVFIRHDSAEICWFRYGLTLGIRTLKIIAITVVFVRVVFALKHSISCDMQTPSMILN